MSLALRLMMALGLLAIASTALVGVGVRQAWRDTEEERFAAQLDGAAEGVIAELTWEARSIRDLLRPVCEHDAFVDQTLIGLERHDLDTGRRLAVTQLVPEQMRALNLDELVFVTSSGEVLGSGQKPSAVGTVDRALGAEVAQASPPVGGSQTAPPIGGSQGSPPVGGSQGSRGELVRVGAASGDPSALLTRCTKARGGQAVGLFGGRYLAPMLARIGRAYGVRLALWGTPEATRRADEDLRITEPTPELGDLRVVATRSRASLDRNLARLDERIVLAAGIAVAIAIVAAGLLARGLARPIEALATQAKEVVRGEPRRVHATGGRELEGLARSFNQAIDDLVALRKRLAITERIAARREIARQVAHEIKNPLAPIRAAVETLRRLRARQDPAFNGYFDEATRTVLDEVHRITRIVSEFTEFARMPPPTLSAVAIAEVAKSVASLHTTGQDEVVLESPDQLTIQADRDQLVQILTNLVQNGLEAARAARPDPRVVVRIENTEKGWVGLSVTDNGPGVAPEMESRLFEPYATNKANGTGLGLAIVHRIVHEHGGTIGYERDAAGGARFRVLLPEVGPTLLGGLFGGTPPTGSVIDETGPPAAE